MRRHLISEVGHWILDAVFRQYEDQNTDQNRFENRAMLNKLLMSRARLVQAHPHFKGRSAAIVRQELGWATEENFEYLLEATDRDRFDRTVRE